MLREKDGLWGSTVYSYKVGVVYVAVPSNKGAIMSETAGACF